MGYSHVGRLTVEPETTYGTAQAAAGNFDQRVIRAIDLSGLVTTRLPDLSIDDRLHFKQQHRDASEFGSKIQIPLYLDGLGSGLNAAAAPVHPVNDISLVLRGLMGGLVAPAAGSSVLGGGATTTSIPVQVGHGARFVKGGACVISGELREIKNIVGDTLTLKMALSAAPADTTIVYNCITFYLDEDEVGGSGDSMVVRHVGLLTNDGWIARGCGGTFGIDVSLDGYLQLNWDCFVADWVKTGAPGITLTGGAFAGGGPLIAKAGQIQWQTPGTTTRNVLPADVFGIVPGLAVQAERSLDGIETVARLRMMAAETKASFSIDGFQAFDEFWTHTDTETTRRMFLLQIGNAPIAAGVGTGIVGLSLPNCQYAARPKRNSAGGLLRVDVELDAREDADITSPTTGTSAAADRDNAKFRIHLA